MSLYVEKSQLITVASGHSGHFGSRGNGYKEEELTSELCIEICRKLNKVGYKAINVSPLSNYSTENAQLKAEVQNANKYNAVLHLCLHFNAFDKKAQGTESFIVGKGGKAEEFANQINCEIVKLGFKNRGVKVRQDLYVPKYTKASCVLVECCFIDSNDMKLYNIDKMSNAFIKGITNVDYIENSNTKYKVVCGVFNNRNEANNLKDEISTLGVSCYVAYLDNFYKVICGTFSYPKNAENMCIKMNNLGYDVEITN